MKPFQDSQNVHPVGWKIPTSSTVTVNDVEKLLTNVLVVLRSCDLDSKLIGQIFKQVWLLLEMLRIIIIH